LRGDSSLWYKTTDGSLFPAPIDDEDGKYDENKKMFTLLGFLIARALYDDRLIDIPLSTVFLDLILERPINFKDIFTIDSNIGNAIKDFLKIIKAKTEFLKNEKYKNPNLMDTDIDLGEEIKYNNIRLDELCILFNLPGYPDIELIPNGLETLLSVYNIEQYVVKIFDKLFGSGIKSIVQCFKTGFNLVFNVNSLKCFYSKEIEESLCGSSNEKWEFDILDENIKPDHGYDKNSSTFRNLLKYMTELDKNDKKKFLLFITGTPRLPVGGI
jgi:E3 ubiquitin-protein ligase TRIP12